MNTSPTRQRVNILGDDGSLAGASGSYLFTCWRCGLVLQWFTCWRCGLVLQWFTCWRVGLVFLLEKKMSESDFNKGEPLGYLLTWTTYGTWLPGDDRGWRRKGEADVRLPNLLSAESAKAKMTEAEFRLTKADREIVAATISRHCEIRNWVLHAVEARSNHVHVVVTAPEYKPETVRDQLKAWCTRKLKANHAGRKNFWTEGGSRRYLNTEDDLDAAIIYVSEAQDRKGLDHDD